MEQVVISDNLKIKIGTAKWICYNIICHKIASFDKKILNENAKYSVSIKLMKEQ